MKLQDAFVAEHGSALGTWKALGYEIGQMASTGLAGSTQNFDFADAITGATNDTITIPSAAGDVWKATSKVALNNCNNGAAWTLKAGKSSTGNGAAWTADISNGSSGNKTDCSSLTPQFERLTTAATP